MREILHGICNGLRTAIASPAFNRPAKTFCRQVITHGIRGFGGLPLNLRARPKVTFDYRTGNYIAFQEIGSAAA